MKHFFHATPSIIAAKNMFLFFFLQFLMNKFDIIVDSHTTVSSVHIHLAVNRASTSILCTRKNASSSSKNKYSICMERIGGNAILCTYCIHLKSIKHKFILAVPAISTCFIFSIRCVCARVCVCHYYAYSVYPLAHCFAIIYLHLIS